MAEERFWNTDEYVSTAKFAVHDEATTTRQAGRIFRLAFRAMEEQYHKYIKPASR